MDNITKKLKVFSKTHPNIASIWISYLSLKHEELLSDIKHCEKIIENEDNLNDVPMNCISAIIAYRSIS